MSMSAADKLRARLAAIKSEKVASTQPEKALEPEPSEQSESPQPTSVVSTEGLEGSAISFKNMLLELEEKLNNRVDNFPYLLRDIHKHCRQDPEVVTILTDEEIGLITRGLKTMAGTILGVETKATGKKTTKKMPVTADML